MFLKVLEEKWERAGEEAECIAGLLRKHGVEPGSTLLDLGCGNGRTAVNLAKLGYRVVGVDISPVFIEDAKKRAAQHGVSDKVEFIACDARELPEALGNRVFDAVINVRSTIIGYYLDESVDEQVLRNAWMVTREKGFLFILNTVNRDLIALVNSIVSRPAYITELSNNMVMIEKPVFNPVDSTIENTWVFYRREGKNLIHIDEVSFKLRVYSLHEIVEIARRAGWRYVESYCNIKTLSVFKPALCGLNVVFQKTRGG